MHNIILFSSQCCLIGEKRITMLVKSKCNKRNLLKLKRGDYFTWISKTKYFELNIFEFKGFTYDGNITIYQVDRYYVDPYTNDFTVVDSQGLLIGDSYGKNFRILTKQEVINYNKTRYAIED